jgi:hypothetical protein
MTDLALRNITATKVEHSRDSPSQYRAFPWKVEAICGYHSRILTLSPTSVLPFPVACAAKSTFKADPAFKNPCYFILILNYGH